MREAKHTYAEIARAIGKPPSSTYVLGKALEESHPTETRKHALTLGAAVPSGASKRISLSYSNIDAERGFRWYAQR